MSFFGRLFGRVPAPPLQHESKPEPKSVARKPAIAVLERPFEEEAKKIMDEHPELMEPSSEPELEALGVAIEKAAEAIATKFGETHALVIPRVETEPAKITALTDKSEGPAVIEIKTTRSKPTPEEHAKTVEEHRTWLLEQYKLVRAKLGFSPSSVMVPYIMSRLFSYGAFKTWNELVDLAGDVEWKNLTSVERTELLAKRQAWLEAHGRFTHELQPEVAAEECVETGVVQFTTKEELVEAYRALADLVGGQPSSTTARALMNKLTWGTTGLNWTSLAVAAGDTPILHLPREKRSRVKARNTLFVRDHGVIATEEQLVQVVKNYRAKQVGVTPAKTVKAAVAEVVPEVVAAVETKQPVVVDPPAPVVEEPVKTGRQILIDEYNTIKEFLGFQPMARLCPYLNSQIKKSPDFQTWTELVRAAGDTPIDTMKIADKTQIRLQNQHWIDNNSLIDVSFKVWQHREAKCTELRAKTASLDIKNVTVSDRAKMIAATRFPLEKVDLPGVDIIKQTLKREFIEMEIELGQTPTSLQAYKVMSYIRGGRLWADYDSFLKAVRKEKQEALIRLMAASYLLTGRMPTTFESRTNAEWDKASVSEALPLPDPAVYRTFFTKLENAYVQVSKTIERAYRNL